MIQKIKGNEENITQVTPVNGFLTKTRYTKNGNPYQKTDAGKIAGTALALGYTSFSVLKNKEVFKQGLHQGLQNTQQQLGKLSAKDIKTIKNAFGASLVITMTLLTLCGTAFGAIIDGIVNKVSANKADKEANA